jgi:hypothetical protein
MSYRVERSAQKGLAYACWAILNKRAMIEQNIAICLFLATDHLHDGKTTTVIMIH